MFFFEPPSVRAIAGLLLMTGALAAEPPSSVPPAPDPGIFAAGSGLLFQDAKVTRNTSDKGVIQVRNEWSAGGHFLTWVNSSPLSPSEADKFLESKVFLIRTSFTKHPAPYSGMITMSESCNGQRPPRIDHDPKNLRLFLDLQANARKTPISCVPETPKYLVYSAFAYDADGKRLQEITLHQLKTGKYLGFKEFRTRALKAMGAK